MASPVASPATVSPTTASPGGAAHVADERPGRAPPTSSKKGSRKCPSSAPAAAAAAPKRPLVLLDLSADILRLIIEELNTTDLPALARAHSALYSLAIPRLYSRFDIVWPDEPAGPSGSKNVDALTYGLSTLSVGSAFARSVPSRRHRSHRSHRPNLAGALAHTDHARYIRKFSLGNGPPDLVGDYDVDRDGGKMLGTLVAAAVAKMANLESFIWDMPTGVLSRVFESLASLAPTPDGSEGKLSHVSVRWHDNSRQRARSGLPDPPNVPFQAPVGTKLTYYGLLLPPTAAHPPPKAPVTYGEYHCEYPTFSVLPPLKSLSVLDIDEIGYLDEMAVLIKRSKDSLKELRVGISAKARSLPFSQAWDGPGLRQRDPYAHWPGASTIGDRRLCGVLGILVSRLYDFRVPEPPAIAATPAASAAANLPEGSKGSQASQPAVDTRKRAKGPLKLHTLALERVALSLQVCRLAFDWSVLTRLTLLDCTRPEEIWTMLRQQFKPTRPGPGGGPAQYRLALRSIHTDHTTVSLMAFLRETLAPNSLEALFLQDSKRVGPPVRLDDIWKSALKPHHASLRKLLLDSSAPPAGDGTRWRQWALGGRVLLYVMSGRMKKLRELAASIHYKDWHAFLRHLTQMPQLRTLHIPHMADYPGGAGAPPREIALQLADMAAVRPELELCFVAVADKCFEIMEVSGDGADGADGGAGEMLSGTQGGSGASTPAPAHAGPMFVSVSEDGAAAAGGQETESGSESEEESDEGVDAAGAGGDGDGEEEENDDGFVETGGGRAKLYMREILFYDEKIEVFRARHGRL